ncbi:MAG: S-layer homology domain-containing protein [Oscillospiraceae bacterium]|nr:S-layer homology domain-containing protein [Oscillospiraceae bacterium]
MKTNLRHKLLSACMALVMLLSLLPVSAMAASGVDGVTGLKTGDTVAIYNVGNGKALTATAAADSKGNAVLASVAATVADGKLSGTGAASFTVTVKDDGCLVFTADGKYLTSGETGSSLTLADAESGLSHWKPVSDGSGAFFLQNETAAYNGNPQFLEFYKDNFTVYGKKDSSDPALYAVSFPQPGGAASAAQTPAAETKPAETAPAAATASPLKDGDTVAIYNDANGKVLTSAATVDSKENPVLAGADAKLGGDQLVSSDAAVFTVGLRDDGCVVFTLGGKYLTSGETGSSLTLADAESELSHWKLLDAGEGKFFVQNAKAAYKENPQFLEFYKNNFTTYSKKDSSDPALYAVSFRQVAPLRAGEQVVIYNAEAKGCMGVDDSGLNTSLANVPAVVADGKAKPDNGAYVFTVGLEGEYYTFKAGEKYLAMPTAADKEELFLQSEKNDGAMWTLKPVAGGYVLYSKSATYKGSPVCVEFYSGHFTGWTFKASNAKIYAMQFYPAAEGVKTLDGMVNAPKVIFSVDESVAKGDALEGAFALDDLISAEQIASVKMTCNGTEVALTGDGESYTFTVPAALTGKAADKLALSVTVTDKAGVSYSGSAEVAVNDEPLFGAVSPAAGSSTGSAKTPLISVEVSNAGNGAKVEMIVAGQAVAATLKDGVISWQPSAALRDGRTSVQVTVTRADGATAAKSWSFTVGTATAQLYFGQLHSHTAEYSDGAGTLADALKYVSELPESANVQFVAFTDHSNYFDTTSAANPEGALYNMSLASAESQAKWKTYKDTVAAFNDSQTDVVALAGFEMTWSGGPGHINTFNTPGIVSRNNTTLNSKTNDAGMKAYYALLSQPEGKDSLSQFNHPGATFGNFVDFSYWDAVTDSRIFTVEVGNGEGQIGAGGYYPSYEQYTMALDMGWHVAPTNNQDNHKGRWGNANDARDVILTDDFSEQGLYNAIRAMRVYATEDKNLELYYTVNDLPLGSSITEVPKALNLKVQFSDPDKADSIAKVEVIVNSGKVAHVWDDAAQLATGSLSATLPPEYSYYYIRVTETDGDLAVTAPVWVGKPILLGVSTFVCGTAMPVTGEELTLTSTLFNSEDVPATVKSIVYTTDGSVVLGTDTKGYTIPAMGKLDVPFQYTPTLGKVMTVTATIVLVQNGKEYIYTKDVTLDVQKADKLVYIGIDASHFNEYVAGNYKDSMGNFAALAATCGIRTVYLKDSASLIDACSNSKYVAMIFTAPSRRLEAAQADPRSYSEAELNAIAQFNKAGGTVIVAGWSDYYENYEVITSNPAIKDMAEVQNELLAALGSHLRIADDATHDETLNGGQTQRLYFNTYNMSYPLMQGVEVDPAHPNDRTYTEVFSHYGGASVYAVSAAGTPVTTLPEGVTPIVYGHATTVSRDSDGDGLGGASVPLYAVSGGKRLLTTASEKIGTQGEIIVSGAAFMSNFEVQAKIEDNFAEKNYANYKFCENLVNSLHQRDIAAIRDVQAQTEAGYKYTVEGVVTSNASGYNKDTAFFDCIYVQDATGGICCFPVAGNFKIGDKVRVTGTTDFYQGEPELQVSEIKVIGTGSVAPTSVSAKDAVSRATLGKLITVSGTVESFELSNGLVQTIMVKDAAGDVVRVFIDGYITTGSEVVGLANGVAITVTGLASYDDTFNAPAGPFPRIRVRNRADVVCGGAAAQPAHWAAEAIAYVTERKIMTGTDKGFEPNLGMTRAMTAQVLYNYIGNGAVSEKDAFPDVAGRWFRNAANWAHGANLVTGTNNGFEGDRMITREEFATILYRYAQSKGQGFTGTWMFKLEFPDAADVHGWANEAMHWMVMNGVINGMDGKLNPRGTLTRAQAATMLMRFLELVK